MDTLIYKLDERPPVGRSLIYAIQWLLIVLPLITVSANLMASFLSMPPDQASALFQRMLFVVGITTAAQCACFFRLPPFPVKGWL
jgi:NCS2 family nucleobase:cation symporter-2